MRQVRGLLAILFLGALVWALHVPHGLVPPIGKLLDPFGGFWQNGSSAADAIPERLALPGLKAPVRVLYDDRRVPHIFASSEHDLYLAQGYITARDRLWQMEFIGRYAGGRLAEIVGPAALPHDEYMRRIGMGWGADAFVKALDADPRLKEPIQAFADGVNAYIRGLQDRDLPVEYKIFDYRPEAWTPRHMGLLLKYMAWDLTGELVDLALTRSRQAFDDAAMAELYPWSPPFLDPIVPPGTAWNFSGRPPGEKTGPGGRPPAAPAGAGKGPTPARPDLASKLIGSNNWAVSGTKTKSGFPILCNDPHLALTLPSIWYEVQLNAPGLNVYGVTLPGAPGVIIGFNESMAWGVTNAGSDVLDWYRIRFKDAGRTEYFYDGAWRKTTSRREEIRVRGGRSVVLNVVYTHHGPVPYEAPPPGETVAKEAGTPYDPGVPAGAAMRWAGHDPSTALLAFLGLNKARGYEDFKAALRLYDCPAQNFVYAGRDGRIAIWHNGRFPLRAKGQGRFLLDGTSAADDWKGSVPWEELPHVEDPPRGFVSSANQPPADAAYPHYLGWIYSTYERGARINELLSGMTAIEPKDMVRMQMDDLGNRPRTVLPALLKAIPEDGLDGVERACRRILSDWDNRYDPDSPAPVLFERLWRLFYDAVWHDDLEGPSGPLFWPQSDVTMDLVLRRPDSPYFDDKTTPALETMPDMALRAFKAAVWDLSREFGPPGPAWAWGRARGTTIGHLGLIPGFGTRRLPTRGGPNVVCATSGDWCASWRMVVALGPEVQAWGVVPGGESGHPGSVFYDTGVQSWVEGRPFELLFLKSAEAAGPRIAGRLVLGGAR